jgi:hypothetical protein
LGVVSSPAAVDLIGVLAYGELGSFERHATDAAAAPTLSDKVQLAAMAATEYRHFADLCAFLQTNGHDPIAAMQPFTAALDAFHASMAPRDWLEGIMKAYVGDGITADFYREMSAYVDHQTAELVVAVVSDTQMSDYAVGRLREAISADPKVAGRLALWGRRLMGELIGQATLVAGSRPAISALFLQHAAEVDGLVNRLTVAHSRRMDALGLAS